MFADIPQIDRIRFDVLEGHTDAHVYRCFKNVRSPLDILDAQGRMPWVLFDEQKEFFRLVRL